MRWSFARFSPYQGSFAESCGQSREAVGADGADVAAAAGVVRVAAAMSAAAAVEVHAKTCLLRM